MHRASLLPVTLLLSHFPSITFKLREGFTKKSSCSFGFCPNYLDPPLPSPKFGQLLPLFLNANVRKKIWAGVPPSHPHPQIDPNIQFVKNGHKFGQAPPPSFGQNPKERLLFFVKPSLNNFIHTINASQMLKKSCEYI